jgi:lipopolysaccharide/colanic/teichoic acid biosynthesis glycosyltransferase
MGETPEKKTSILYIGNDKVMINQLKESGLFDVEVMPNGLAAIYWLTDNSFQPFKFEQDASETPRYEESRNISGIVCESSIPGMRGIDFYHKLKLHQVYTKIPFIIITNYLEPDVKNEAIEVGIDDCYIFPPSPEKLHSRINFLLKLKKDYVPKSLEDIIDHSLLPYKTPLIKRIFDVSVAGLALLILSPIMIITAIAIWLESRGKIYYFSKRVGANYKIFNFYKFRSMYPDADKRLKEVSHLNQYITETVEDECSECAKLPEGEHCSPMVYYDGEEICERLANKRKNARKAFLKIVDDPRITKVGKFIRRSSIDELPQLFNILKGDMSIVGNRPLPLNEAEALTKKKWSRRFRASAGLTGLWQVKKRGKGGSMSEEERFALDNYYAEHNSFWGDLVLIFKTFGAVFQKENV